jgi:hypothetical protein
VVANHQVLFGVFTPTTEVALDVPVRLLLLVLELLGVEIPPEEVIRVQRVAGGLEYQDVGFMASTKNR